MKKRLKIKLISLTCLLLIAGAGFGLYVSDYYWADEEAAAAMASDYASAHPDKVKGLVLLGAYLYGDFPAERSLTLYGSEDKVMDRSKLTYTENVHEIQGGNHAQFGSYGHTRLQSDNARRKL